MSLLDSFKRGRAKSEPPTLELLEPTILGLGPGSDPAALKSLAKTDVFMSIDYDGSEPKRVTITLADLSKQPTRYWPGTLRVAGNERKPTSTTALDIWPALPVGSRWRGDDALVEIAIPHGPVTKFVICSRRNGKVLRAFVEPTVPLQDYADKAQTPEFGAHRYLSIVAPEGANLEGLAQALDHFEYQQVAERGGQELLDWYTTTLGFDEPAEIAIFWSAGDRIVVTLHEDVVVAGMDPEFQRSLHGIQAARDVTTLIMQMLDGKMPPVQEDGTIRHRSPRVDAKLRNYQKADGSLDTKLLGQDVLLVYSEESVADHT